MKEVRVHKVALLKKLEENLIKHRAEFEEAKKAWALESITILEEQLGRLLESHSLDGAPVLKQQPTSYEKHYLRSIEMLKMSIEDDLVLSETEFSQYVLDEWSWSNAFKMVTSGYIKS